MPSLRCPSRSCLLLLLSACPLGSSFRDCWASTFSITAKPCKTTQKVVGAWETQGWGGGMRKGSGLSGSDLDKDTLAFRAKGGWETWEERGINRDANGQGTHRKFPPDAGGGGGVVWVPAGPLRTGELLRFLKGWEAPSFCFPLPSPQVSHFSEFAGH